MSAGYCPVVVAKAAAGGLEAASACHITLQWPHCLSKALLQAVALVESVIVHTCFDVKSDAG